jgi:hypothetical protein
LLHLSPVEAAYRFPNRSNPRAVARWTPLPLQGVPPRGLSEADGRVKLVCAWCVKAGLPALMAEKEPLSDPTETHGLCPDHRKQVEVEIAEHRRKVREAMTGLDKAAKELEEKVDP